MKSGRAVLDFGTSDTHVSVAVSMPEITAAHLVTASVMAATTSDHTADEHVVEPLRITAGDIVAGTGFTVHGTLDSAGTTSGEFVVTWRVSYPGES